MAHQLGLLGDTVAPRDFVTALEHIAEGGGNHTHVVVGICATWNGQTAKVKAAETVFARHRVAVGKNIADFAGADSGLFVKLHSERLGGEFLFGDVGEHLRGIHKIAWPPAGRW